MTYERFQKLGLRESVIWPNGVEGPVEGIDESDNTILDHCGGWHDYPVTTDEWDRIQQEAEQDSFQMAEDYIPTVRTAWGQY